jgi:ABC-type nitrate/sulfonate/bicarbonate transport system permease component
MSIAEQTNHIDGIQSPAPDERDVPYRGGRLLVQPIVSVSWLTAAAVIALWAAVTLSGWADPLFLPDPVSVLRALWNLSVHGTLLADVGVSLVRILSGWTIGTLAGLFVGTLMGVSSVGRSVGTPLIGTLFPIPKIAMLPLFILWFGIGEPSKIATIALGVFFPTAISTTGGIENVSRQLVRMGLSFNLPARSIIFKVLLPGALPAILSGFRISSALALILLVSAEMIGAERGIGSFVLQAGSLMQTDQLLAGVVVLSLLGFLISLIVSAVERRVLTWR